MPWHDSEHHHAPYIPIQTGTEKSIKSLFWKIRFLAENRGKSCQRQLMRICIFCGTVTKNPVTLEKVEKDRDASSLSPSFQFGLFIPPQKCADDEKRRETVLTLLEPSATVPLLSSSCYRWLPPRS